MKTLKTCDIRTISERLAAHRAQPVERPDLRPAAVLVPLFPSDDGLSLLLIRRPQTLSRHAGQIAFPGGVREVSDPDLCYTALRESHEEVGLAPDRVEVLGELDHVWTPTGFSLVPYVGFVAEGPVGVADPGEVDEILRVRVEDLMQPGVFREEQWERDGVSYRVVFFDMPCGSIWGATGRVLLRLLQVGFAWGAVADRPWESGPTR